MLEKQMWKKKKNLLRVELQPLSSSEMRLGSRTAITKDTVNMSSQIHDAKNT